MFAAQYLLFITDQISLFISHENKHECILLLSSSNFMGPAVATYSVFHSELDTFNISILLLANIKRIELAK